MSFSAISCINHRGESLLLQSGARTPDPRIFYLFKLIYLRSIAKQVIPTYINHSQPLIPDGIHLFF